MHRGGRQKISAIAVLGAFFLCAAESTAAQSGVQHRTKIAGGKTLTDDTGRRVAVPPDVQRIVTLAPDLTETIYALGLEEHLVGDTENCDTPPAAKSKPHVGTPISPSLEAVVALHPDLVLATTSINRRDSVDALRHLGIAVYTTDPHTVEGMLKSIEQIAFLTNAGEPGAALVTGLRARLETLHARLADAPLVHVLFVVWEDPLITIGQNTFIADALRWAGGESVILSKQNWPRVGMETVVQLQPDYIVLTSDHHKAEGNDALELRERPGWKNLRAVERGHIAVIGAGVDRPAPGLVDAIEQLARVLHPEAFREKSESGKLNMGPQSNVTATFSNEVCACAL